jgi:high affinity sulfate transporter 1
VSGETRATDAGSTGPRLAILEGIRPYDRRWLPRDVLAGVTLAALGIPEVMGYTKISGTPVITGLYTLLLPMIVFAILGSSRHLVVGGDSATAAILAAGLAGLGLADVVPGSPDWLALAGLSALMCGALLLVARLLGLGFLADFISRTVLVGFLTGVGVQVALGQVGGMLGVPKPAVSLAFGSGTITSFLATVGEIGEANLLSVAVSAAVIAILVVFGRWVKAIPGGLVAVVGAIVLSFALDLAGRGLAVVGPVPGGLPAIGLPAGLSVDHALALLTTVISMVLVILAQSAATSRAYAVRYDERFVENDDLVGLGAANLAAGLSGTFVVNGSPTKTEMVDDAKGRTQVAQLATAATVAIVLLFLTRPLEYLPEAVLSTVVFMIGLKLIDLRGLGEIRRLRPEEFWIAVVTAAVVVTLGVEQGILLAIVLSVLDHVRRHYQPHNTIVTWDDAGRRILVPAAPGVMSEPGLIVYRFAVGLFFANATGFADQVRALTDAASPPRWFALLADAMDDVDFTGGRTVVDVARRLRDRGITFAVVGASAKVRRELDLFGLDEVIGEDRYFAGLGPLREAFAAGGDPDGPAGSG